MAHVVQPLDKPSTYRDSQSHLDRQRAKSLLDESTTLYVGNLSFFTTEQQIYELFSRCTDPLEGGGLKRIIMGLDRMNKTPCGFCFVEYYTHEEALASMRYISGTRLDERVIRCDLDPGYIEGRQFGRGKNGGQVRDEFRQEYDAGRGGWGHQRALAEKEAQDRARGAMQYEVYAGVGGTGLGGGQVPQGEGADQMLEENRKRERDGDESEDDEPRQRERRDSME
ncbi:rna-binding domain-containing protein [Phaffia rhodozyma]|uniref:Nuclear cap-binding protein subunit 2 n=1 Tax=Phaffia rhodozyma TaxID=264483 RepID=A0A0F7SR16_PHARH|nr:rna-binding domain-containing protein [Phaffia rhodozyma]